MGLLSLPRISATGVRLSSAIALLIGSSWLVLWFAGVAPRWSAAATVAKTNMAVCQVLAGTALLLLSSPAPGAPRRRVGLGAAGLVSLISALTFSEHLFGIDLRIDQLLGTEPSGAVATVSPNRMGPPGACGLMLIGMGLILLPFRHARFAPWLGVAACVMNLVPAVGFIYGIDEFHNSARFTGIAWSSVIALTALGLGLVMSRPADAPAAQFLRADAGGALLRRLWPAVVLIPLALGFLGMLGHNQNLFSTAAGAGTLVIAVVLVFSVLLWKSAAELSHTAEAQTRAETAMSSVALFPEENPFPVMRAAHDGTLLYANRSSAALVQEWQCAVGERVPGFAREVIAAALESSKGAEMQLRVGESEFTLVAMPIAGRDYVNLYGYDITTRRQAEEAVRRERDFSNAVLDTAGALVVVMDRAGRIIRFNRACAATTGYSEEEVLGRELWDILIPPEEMSGVQKIWDALIAKDFPNTYENHWLSKQGPRRLITWSNTAILDESGEVRHVIATGLDVTERKKRETLAAELNRISQLVYSRLSIDEIMRQTLARTAGVLGNETAAISLRRGDGWTVSHAHGLPAEILGARMNDDQEPHAVLAIRTRLPVAVEDAFTDPRTNHQHMRKWNVRSVMVIPLLSKAEPVGVLFLNYHQAAHAFTPAELDFGVQVASSLSLALQNARLFEELRRHADTLEHTVAQRTARLSELVSDLEHLSYTLAHDLRAPLRSIRGFADILKTECSDCPSTQRIDFLRRIATSCEHLDNLIRDTLQFTRAVRQELPLEPVDLSELLASILTAYPNLNPDEADIEIEGHLPVVLGNKTGLSQCFANLLGNAVKFVSPGTRPHVRIHADAAQGTAARPDLARIWIEDNGIGIPKERVPQLFQLFVRLSKHHEGTGVGLALVRKVLQRMGGAVGVESEAGKGSRFWVELRLANDSAKAE